MAECRVKEEAWQRLQALPESERDYTAKQVLRGIHENFLSSGGKLVTDLKDLAANPKETVLNIGKITLGYGNKLLNRESEYNQYADQVNKYLGDRYGSIENLKRSIAQDPVGVLADFSTLFGGGGGALRVGAKLSGAVAKTAKKAALTAKATSAGPQVAKDLAEFGKKAEKASSSMRGIGERISTIGTYSDPIAAPLGVASKILGATESLEKYGTMVGKAATTINRLNTYVSPLSTGNSAMKKIERKNSN